MSKNEVLILYSGGVESRVLLDLAKMLGKVPTCLLIDYGQKHIQELAVAKKICSKYKVHFLVSKVEGLDVNSKLTGDGTSSFGVTVSEWYVPSRNMLFIAMAASVAESRGIELLWYGASYSDRIDLFTDCYQEWVVKVNELLAIHCSTKVQVEAPLLGFNKETVHQWLSVIKAEKEVFSGYGE
jgi:7-cyano-7-deazaguanine synthase